MAVPFSKPQHEPALDRSERRARGVFYTPVEVAEWIVKQTYGPLLQQWDGQTPPPRLLDPACGAGVFLIAAAKLVRDRCAELGFDNQRLLHAQHQTIRGIDIDQAAVNSAREQLRALGVSNIQCADSLAASKYCKFDAIVGNPPYVNIRELAKSHTADEVQRLRERFETARGNFDLYVLFIERALELLRPGGRLGFIIPNKWATLDYAQPLRALLLRETTLQQIVDLSAVKVFPQAGTYPQIVLLEKRTAPRGHRLQITEGKDFSTRSNEPSTGARLILQAQLNARGFVLGEEIRVEERVPTLPLEQCARLHSGASGYSANLIAESLCELETISPADRHRFAEFIVSGNIDRYAVHSGSVRFLKQTWQRPCLPLDKKVTLAKVQLFRQPKIVFSGMSRRLEAAYDEQGRALGVQVYAAAELQVDPYYLLGVLNSKLLSYLFRERFAAKRLAGGYLAINKGQLAQLPIRVADQADSKPCKLQQLIGDLARQLQRSYSAAVDQQLDELVYRLYAIDAVERERIEKSFELNQPAATKKRAA